MDNPIKWPEVIGASGDQRVALWAIAGAIVDGLPKDRIAEMEIGWAGDGKGTLLPAIRVVMHDKKGD